MANTNKYLNHLLQNTEITPACSEEERACAELIANVFRNHGFEPEVQEFSASGSYKVVQAAMGIAAFIGAVLMGIGGPVGIVGLLLCVASAVIFWLERSGRPVFSQIGSGGLSQNVIAYHRASGPLASPRNRPVVVVAHYDSPRADLLSQEPYAAYRPIIVKLLPYAMVVPSVIAVVRLLPLPDAAKVVLWVIAILAALIPLANAIAVIANRFVLPYTTGAVCNKSSVAAMLGVMDAVAPYELGEEFPKDVPFEEYFAEQQRILEEAIAAAEAAQAAETEYPHEQAAAEGDSEEEPAAEPAEQVEGVPAQDVSVDLGGTAQMTAVDLMAEQAPAVGAEEPQPLDADADDVEPEMVDLGSTVAMSVESFVEQPVDEYEDAASEPIADEGGLEDEQDDAPYAVNADGNIRFGQDAIRALGMLPEKCVIVYEDAELPFDEEVTAFDVVPEPEVWEAPVEDPACLEVEHEQVEDDVVYEDESEGDAEEQLYEEQDPDSFGEDVEYVDEYVGADEAPFERDERLAEDEVEDLTEVDDDFDPVQGFETEPTQDALPIEDVQQPAFEDQPVETAPSAGSTVAMPIPQAFQAASSRPVETVDSLMAEISHPAAPRSPRSINVPSTADAPVPHTPSTANRASLFDLPDPSANHVDPFSFDDPLASRATAVEVPAVPEVPHPADSAEQARNAFTVISSPAAQQVEADPERFERISAPAPAPERKPRGLGRLFGRKKKQDSMSEWLGVDDDFDAKRSGGDIGSWDNFDDDWKGGAVSMNGASEDELREAIADMGDDELLGHDIWFVATGASECGNAGIKAFLDTHRDKLRGVFLINLECVGSGQVAMLSTEGERRVLKGDKRIMKLVSSVSADFHHEYGAMDMPYMTTDAYAAMSMSLRSLTLAGVEGNGFALSHTEEDQPYNVDPENIAVVSDVVTEVIRRS